MTRGLDTPWRLHSVLLSRQGLGIWMSFMTWIRLTVHWIVSDCDLGKVSVTHQTGVLYGYVLYGLHTGVRGHAASMRPGS